MSEQGVLFKAGAKCGYCMTDLTEAGTRDGRMTYACARCGPDLATVRTFEDYKAFQRAARLRRTVL